MSFSCVVHLRLYLLILEPATNQIIFEMTDKKYFLFFLLWLYGHKKDL